MIGGKRKLLIITLAAILSMNSFVAWANLQVMADENVGGDIKAVYSDSWMEEQPSIPADVDKLIQFNRDQPNSNAYHLGDTNVNVWITFRNTDSFDNIYVDSTQLISNHVLFTPNQDEDNGNIIPAGGTFTFHFTIDIGTNGNVNVLYQDALSILLQDMEQPLGNNIGDETFDFDIYVSSIFDPDSGDSQTDIHENLSDIYETDIHPDFEAGEYVQEGKIQLANHAGFSISDIEANLDVSGIPENIVISGGNNMAMNPGPISANGGNLELLWNFDVFPTVPPDYYMPELELSYNRSDTGAIIVENFRNTGLYVAPSTTVTSPVGGPVNKADINITYFMTGTPPNVTIYYTLNTSAPYSWMLIDTDNSPDGYYDWIAPADGSYGWFAISENETAPNSSTPPEASYYIYDGTPPELDNTDPVNSADEVSVELDVELTFDEVMNITSFSYAVEPDPGGLSEAWGASNESVTISHMDFLTGSRYWVNITAGRDLAGNNLNPLPYSFYFDTIDISATATATGPIGGPTNISTITISYTTTNNPAGVELFYTTNTSSPYQWISIETDRPPGGSYLFTLPDDGSYGWNAVATDESPPTSTDIPEAGFYIYGGTPPEVVSTNPDNGAIGVTIDLDISIAFSEMMNSSTFAYSIEPNPGGLSEMWNIDITNMTIFHMPFTSNTRYWINITSGEDMAGNHLNILPYSFYYDTIIWDITPPSVVSTSPSGSNVDISSDITITLSEAMDRETVESAFSFTDGTTVWDISDGAVIWDAVNETMTFAPSFDLSYNTTYNVTFSSTAKDIVGNYLTTHIWHFTVMPEPDTTAPSVDMAVYSRDEIEKTYSISFIFSEPMNHSSVENAISVSPDSPDMTFNWVGNNLKITLSSDLKPGKEYRFTIGTEAKDEAGNTLSEPYTLTITTEEEPEDESPTLWLLPILIIVMIVILLLIWIRKRKNGEKTTGKINGEESTLENGD